MKDNRRQTPDKTWLAILAITLVAFGLRAYRLDFYSLRGDEAFTVVFVQRTWEGLWKGISTIEPNPPLMYLALRAWVAVAGASEFATRFFSAFFGVLCVPLLYRLARALFAGRNPFSARKWVSIALIAAALIAINPYQIGHSQDVRNYTVWPALSMLALIFLWRWWNAERRQTTDNRQQTISNLPFYVLITLASLYTHYYDTFILVAANIFVFAFTLWERRWKTLARWVGAQIVLALLYAPWVLFGTNRITTYGEASAEQSVSLLDAFRRTSSTFVLGDTIPEAFQAVLWFPLTLALAAILIYLAQQSLRRRVGADGAAMMDAVFLFLYIAVPTVALYIVSIGRPLFGERYLNGIAPAYYLTVAVGIGALVHVGRGAAATPSLPTPTMSQSAKADLAMLLQQWFDFAHHRFQLPVFVIAILFFISTSAYALSNYYFNPQYAKAVDWRALMKFIGVHQEPGDFVIQNFTEMSAIYYRQDDLPVMTLPKDYWATPADEKTLRQLNRDYRRIWFIPASPGWWDDAQFVEKFLSRNDERLLDTRVAAFRLQLYLTPREFAPKMIPVNERVGNATLVGYRVEGARNLHVALYWRAERRIEKDFTVFVHLADADNGVIAQHDGAPAFGTYPTMAWQAGELVVDVHDVPAGAAPGTYALLVGMYDPATLARVPAFDVYGARLSNDRILLTQVTIVQ